MNSTTSSSTCSWLHCFNLFRKERAPELCLLNAPQVFSWEDIRRITKNFSTLIGLGGFGSVYVGHLPDWQLVAVKVPRDDSNDPHMKSMKTELELVGSVRHANIVKLLGWCFDSIEGRCALLFDYMPNESLHDLLRDKSKPFAWDFRFRVAKELGAALFYLHHCCEIPIIHRDVKPANVFFDSEFRVRLGGFDVGIRTSSEEHETTIIGTLGYIDPEYICTSTITKYADVYAYGIILLQLVTGIDGYKFKDSIGDLSESSLPVDARLDGAYNDSELSLLIHLGLLCIRPQSKDRPDMRRVLNILDFLVPLDHSPLGSDIHDSENISFPLSPA